MILLSENQQSVLSFLIALLRPQESAHGRTLQHPLPTAAPDFASRGRPRAEAYRPLRSGSGDPPRAKFGEIAARGSGGKFSHSQALINQKMRKKSRFPDPAATAGHHRQRRRTRDRRFRREPSPCRGCRTVGRSPELSRAMEKPLANAGSWRATFSSFDPAETTRSAIASTASARCRKRRLWL